MILRIPKEITKRMSNTDRAFLNTIKKELDGLSKINYTHYIEDVGRVNIILHGLIYKMFINKKAKFKKTYLQLLKELYNDD